MAEVAASVGIVEQANAVAAQASSMSFVDGDTAADPAGAILDEVLAGTSSEAAAEPAEATAEGEPTTETKPAEAAPVAEAPPANDIESAKLRKGFAKLADERQRLVQLQNDARTAIAGAQQYAAKAQRHDEVMAQVTADPAAFLLAHGGEALVQKALQGFIEMEKSPAERAVAQLRKENDEREAKRAQQEQERTASEWRNGIVAKVQGDDRFDLVNTLGLHGDVIAVMTGYYEKHSERDAKGNVTRPAILSWEDAAQAVESTREAMIEKSKRYGKRTPAAATGEQPGVKKDAPAAKPASAPAKRAPTSLSSVPVAETPALADDFPTNDNDAREARLLAEMGL